MRIIYISPARVS